jgi:hypothetical protein
MRSLRRTYGPSLRWVRFRLHGEPPNGRWQPIRIMQIIGGRWWSLDLTRTEPIEPRRPEPARITTSSERAPLYAAYAAARQRSKEIGYQCEDDSIIQYAVKAYETAEMARLRAQVSEAFAVAAEMTENSQDPLTTAYATQLRDRLYQAGPDTGSYGSDSAS